MSELIAMYLLGLVMGGWIARYYYADNPRHTKTEPSSSHEFSCYFCGSEIRGDGGGEEIYVECDCTSGTFSSEDDIPTQWVVDFDEIRA